MDKQTLAALLKESQIRKHFPRFPLVGDTSCLRQMNAENKN